MIERRTLLKVLLSAFGVGALPLSAFGSGISRAAGGSMQGFSYAWLKGRARALAGEAHVSIEGQLPRTLKNL